MNLDTASLEELKAHRDAVVAKIKEVEHNAIEELEQKASALGFELKPAEPKKERRKCRTREEMDAARAANGPA